MSNEIGSRDGHDPAGMAGLRSMGWTIWSIVAAFGTYFCMYAFRKPFTAESNYPDPDLWGIDYKTILVTAQVAGYMVSKFIGIKVIAETPPARRAMRILVLIGLAELALLLFAITPAPWSALCLFLNGLPLGMVFGLVLGFLEGRKRTELLAAGLCASFIVADGVTKSLGLVLRNAGVPVHWMPFAAGLVATPGLLFFVAMLARIPAPNGIDVALRAARSTMNGNDRWVLFKRYAPGLSLLVFIYLLVTIIRSMRADFGPEIWKGLGVSKIDPSLFAKSETLVALGVLLVNGASVLILDNRRAFFVSLATCGAGLLLIPIALAGNELGWLSPFGFMVLIGLGLYFPYIAIHTTIFERLVAMTRERATTGYLMYLADAFGYLGYVAVMLSRHLVSQQADPLGAFLSACIVTSALGLVGLTLAWWYFHWRCSPARLPQPAVGAPA